MSGVPRHLALVPDGNRRWAKAFGRPGSHGHRAGIANVGRIADHAWQAGVEVVTFWWGSPANLTLRSPEEVEAIIGSLGDWLADEGAALVSRHHAWFEAIGRWPELAPGLAPGIATAQATAGAGPKRLVCLIGYDGREEIADAAARVGGGPVDVARFGEALWTGHLPPVDLLIRTGGEPHLSAGFMAWGIAEAQLAFVAPPWPAFGPDDLDRCLEQYAATQRRFGR